MFSLSFSTSNAARAEDGIETSDIIHIVASKVASGQTSGPVRDTNGNTIGEWSLTPND